MHLHVIHLPAVLPLERGFGAACLAALVTPAALCAVLRSALTPAHTQAPSSANVQAKVMTIFVTGGDPRFKRACKGMCADLAGAVSVPHRPFLALLHTSHLPGVDCTAQEICQLCAPKKALQQEMIVFSNFEML